MKLKKIDESFFNKDTLSIAKSLIGCFLIHEVSNKKLIGEIIETEAYLENDPASHSFMENKLLYSLLGRYKY